METYGIKFSDPREVNTIRGLRLVRSGEPTKEFWDTWKKKKAELKEAGISVTKTNSGYVVNLWQEPDVEEKNQKIDDSKKTSSDFKPDVPEGLLPYPYQRAGIEYILNTPSCLLGDEMGLGKTIQAIVAWNMANAKRVLVVCPASLKLNWKKEIHKWSTKPYSVHVVGPAKWKPFRSEYQVVVINYDILRKHHDELREFEWDFLVADEAHYVKSSKAIRSKELLGFNPTKRELSNGTIPVLPIPSKRRLLITGTPMTSKPKDLFPLLNYLNPSEWDNFFKFALRYCGAHKKSGYWDFNGSSNTGELNTRLRGSLMIRRLKQDVLTELPDKLRQPIVWGPTTKNEKDLIASEGNYRKENLDEILKSVSSGRGFKIDFEDVAKTRKRIAMAKLPKVVDHVIETLESEDKLVVFFHHKDLLRGVEAELKAKRISYVTLTGDTSHIARQEAVENFQEGSTRVFLGTMGAAGVGITLTAARTVIFAELPGDWNPSTLLQSEDRLHRIGQENNVLIQYLVLEGTIEAHVAEVISGKQEVSHRILDEEEKIQTKELPEAVKAKPRKEKELPEISIKEMDAIREDLEQIAAMDGDKAREKNNVGFNKFDSTLGHSLVNTPEWTQRQARAAKHLTIKYGGQLGK